MATSLSLKSAALNIHIGEGKELTWFGAPTYAVGPQGAKHSLSLKLLVSSVSLLVKWELFALSLIQ